LATILRRWSYEYPWLYDGISRLASLGVGGERRFRTLALGGLTLNSDTEILDLCCGGGQTTQYLAEISRRCTGLDISPVALARAQSAVPQAHYIQGLAQELPFGDRTFDLVHTSVALHEMNPEELAAIFREVYRVLKPGGVFAFIDFHTPTMVIFWPPLAIFMALFETQTAWELLKMDLVEDLNKVGFKDCQKTLSLGGSLQVIQAKK